MSNDAVDASATCEASLGDGWGGTEQWVGNVGSLAECAALVIDQYPTANGVTYCPTGSSGTLSCSVRDCWAHLDMVGISTTTPQYESCFLDLECRPCPAGTQATWQQSWLGGDGIGGTEELLSDQPSPEACAELVRTTRPEANGASFAGQKCYAEFGMTGVSTTGDATYYVTAEFADPPTTSETFQTGDGTGTSELLLGTAADAQACAALVKSERPSANGATYQQFSDPDASPVRTHQACFAEYGMTQITGSANSMWQSTFFLNTGCDTCAAGKVSGEGDAEGCVSCGGGEEPNSAKDACELCAAGRKSTAADTECSACAAGEFSAAGVANCEMCAGGTQPNSAQSACENCAAGQFSRPTDTSCSACAAGQASQAGAVVCEVCGGGTQPDVTKTTCETCGAGKKSGLTDTICSDCATGEASQPGAVKCETCSGGKQPDSGSTTCEECLAGQYSSQADTSCKSCDAGKASQAGAVSCIACDEGKYASDDQSACIACADDKYAGAGSQACSTCGLGLEPDDEQSKCELCGTDHVNTGSGCYSCRDEEGPAGQTADWYSTSADDHTSCVCQDGCGGLIVAGTTPCIINLSRICFSLLPCAPEL